MSRLDSFSKPILDQPKPPLAPLAKGQFRCFRCRNIFLMKDGDWFHWNAMEVHLCTPCDKQTRSVPERNPR
jgi:hypothetical protein